MSDDKLDAMTDAELNECFAVEVANTPRADFARHVEPPRIQYRNDKNWGAPPAFCTSADAVLPWLEKCVGGKWETTYVGPFHSCRWWRYEVHLTNALNDGFEGRALTFPRAAVLALIRAKRTP